MIPSKYVAVALLVAGGTVLDARAEECIRPPAPSKIPDGSSASQQEMLTAMQTMKEYNNDVATYLKCLDFEAKQNHLSSIEVERRHNSALEELTKTADRFNQQVRTFKAKTG